MQVSYQKSELMGVKADVLVIPVSKNWEKRPELKQLNEALAGELFRRTKKAQFKAKAGSSFVQQCPGSFSFDRVALTAVDAKETPNPEDLWDMGHKLANRYRSKAVSTLAIWCDFAPEAKTNVLFAKLTQGVLCGGYRFDKYFTDADAKATKTALKKLLLIGAGAHKPTPAVAKAAIARGVALGESTNLARDLVNEPAESMTPQIFASQVQKVAKANGLQCKVENEAQIKKRGMGLFLAVARGSKNPPRLITLTHNPKNATGKPIVLVGKGLMYDSGGYSLKPSSGMETMKCDMSGSAAVVGALTAIARLGVKRKVIGIVAACENMIGSGAYRVGDIYTSMSGKTVEVMNTDAEGRLTLADALTYGESFKPACIVDVATLTGACVVALGEETVGVFSADDKLAADIESAFERAGEDAWRMPMNKRLKKLLKSPIADMKNVGSRWGGAITAGLFLSNFVEKAPFAHLDIAGPAFHTGEVGHLPKGGTGVAVTTLVELVDPSSK